MCRLSARVSLIITHIDPRLLLILTLSTNAGKRKVAKLWKRHSKDLGYRIHGKPLPDALIGFMQKCKDFSFTLLPPLFPGPHQGLSKKHSESRRLCLILCKCEAVTEGSRALGLGHFGNTSHMTLPLGGPRKLILCFFTPHSQPPNLPKC